MGVDKATRDCLIGLYNNKGIALEGNILKFIDADEGDEEFKKYLRDATEKDKDTRRKRLDITKQIQSQNIELSNSRDENIKINEELKEALLIAEEATKKAEAAKEIALNDLEVLRKKSQTELMGKIVKVSLIVIISVGVLTTLMYVIAMLTGKETQIIGSTWSNVLSILLTNAFSIVGTIMGVKYATEKEG